MYQSLRPMIICLELPRYYCIFLVIALGKSAMSLSHLIIPPSSNGPWWSSNSPPFNKSSSGDLSSSLSLVFLLYSCPCPLFFPLSSMRLLSPPFFALIATPATNTINSVGIPSSANQSTPTPFSRARVHRSCPYVSTFGESSQAASVRFSTCKHSPAHRTTYVRTVIYFQSASTLLMWLGNAVGNALSPFDPNTGLLPNPGLLTSSCCI